MFLFQEETNSPDVYLLRLYKDDQPFLFKFNLHESVTAGLINTTFDERKGRFEVPQEPNVFNTVDHDASAILKSEDNELFSSITQNN